MRRGHSRDQPDVTRRDYLFGTGSVVALCGIAGCLGLGDDDQQTEEPEDEIEENASEEESEDEGALEDPDGEGDEGDGNEATEESHEEPENELGENGSSDGATGNQFGDETAAEDAADDDDVDDEGDSSIFEKEDPNDNDSADESEDDGETTENESEDTETGDEETDNATTDEWSEDESEGEDDSESDQADEDSGGEDTDGGDRFEQYSIEELSYQVDYPADWVIEGGDDYVQIQNDDETAWLWIEIREARTDLDREVRHFREEFDPNPSVEIHADDPVTLSTGEEGHRFIIEMTERERNLFAHELIAQANGYLYRTVVVVSRSVYNEEYAQLAEEILATVALR